MWGNKCDTWNWGRRRKEDPQQVPHEASTPTTREKTTKNVYLTSVRSAALPGTEASNFTYTKIQRKTTEGTREKTKGTQAHLRIKVRREQRRREGEKLGMGSGIWGSRVGVGLGCWSSAYDRDSCHVSGRGNQSAPAACISCTQPLLRMGLHAVTHTLSPGKRVPGCEGSAALL